MAPAPLRTMILTGGAPRHLYVANVLARIGEPLAIVQETGSGWTLAKVAKLMRPAYAFNKISRAIRDRARYRDGGEAKFFFGTQAPRLERADLLTEVTHINHPSLVQLVDRLQPDVIAVFGTTLIRPPLLGRARLGMLNLHGGLSPEYRGADCTFWALYNGEPEKVGCTIHFIDIGIDTGRLIAHVCPAIQEGDAELPLFWRAVRDSAEVYAQALQRLAEGQSLGRPQAGKGRLYQVRQRLGSHERELERKVAAGLLTGVSLPPRVTWFDPVAGAGERRSMGTGAG